MGAFAVLQGWRYVPGNLPVAIVILAFGIALLIGIFTVIVSVLMAVGLIVVCAGHVPGAGLFIEPALSVSLSVVAVSIALVGPGAFSVDARLFGMRQVVIAREPVGSDSGLDPPT